MGFRGRLDASVVAPPSPPSSVADSISRPTTPSTPVRIPRNNLRHSQKTNGFSTTRGRRQPNPHSSEDISPSVAAILALTDIPRQRSQRRKRRSAEVLTVDDVVDGQNVVSEKELSWTLRCSPMAVLLSPPEDFADDDASVSECNIGSALSTTDSIPSLGESFTTEGVSSFESSGSPLIRGRRPSPMRRSLEPVLSPPGEGFDCLDHPLARKASDNDLCIDSLPESIEEEPESRLLGQLVPLSYAFKSNLTASLRALRSAARSFSTINFSSIPSDDFLTRSLLTIDTRVPYADERRPPVTEEIPSAELRRYLNPTTSSHPETQLAVSAPLGKISASIQMQTYKVQRSRIRNPQHRPSSQQATSQQNHNQSPSSTSPGMRQREMRENSDFIRIAVMEMAMRKAGKLDDQRPGRARWALPPRKMSTTTYEIGTDGVPARWRCISY